MINTIIARFVAECYGKGVAEIVIGNVTHIRENGRKGKKTNAMINNFWSFDYIYERLRMSAENYGMRMKKKDEHRTSKTCCPVARSIEEGEDTVGYISVSSMEQQ